MLALRSRPSLSQRPPQRDVFRSSDVCLSQACPHHNEQPDRSPQDAPRIRRSEPCEREDDHPLKDLGNQGRLLVPQCLSYHLDVGVSSFTWVCHPPLCGPSKEPSPHVGRSVACALRG